MVHVDLLCKYPGAEDTKVLFQRLEGGERGAGWGRRLEPSQGRGSTSGLL